jgi:uncharacterized protein (DUF934 family)
MTLGKFAGTVRGCQGELKAIGDVLEAIVNSDAGHGNPVFKVNNALNA